MAYIVTMGYFGEKEREMDYPEPTITIIGVCLTMENALDYIRQISLNPGYRDYTNDEMTERMWWDDHEIRKEYKHQPIRCTINRDENIFKYYYIIEAPILKAYKEEN